MDEKEIDNEYGFEEETSERNDSEVEVDSGATETEEANTSVEDSAVESQEVESNDIDFENNYTEPQDYGWLVNVSDEDTTKKDEYSEGFNPEYYEYAQELVGNEFSSFNMSKNEAKEAYDDAQKSVDTAKDRYEKAVESYNEKESQAKEMADMFGFDTVDIGISKPGTLEEFTQKYVDEANKAKEEYSKYENDSEVFQTYLDKYKDDWDKYQSTLSKEEVKENKNLVSEAVDARFKAEQAATMYLFEKYGIDFMNYMPKGGWTIENCQKIVDASSKASLTEAGGKQILDSIIKANNEVRNITNDPEGTKRTEALNSANTTLPDGTKITNVIGNGLGIMLDSPNGTKTLIQATETSTPNFWDLTVREKASGSDSAEVVYSKSHVATKVLEKEMSKSIADSVNKNSSEVDDKLVELAKNVIEANTNVDKAEKEEEAARHSRREEANEMKKDAFEAYKNGEISAVEYSNLMNKAEKLGGTVDLVYTEPLRAKEKVELPGNAEYDKIVTEFQYLNSIKDKVNNINVNEVKDEAQAKTIQNELVETQAQLIEQSHTVFVDIVKDLVAQGKELKDIRDSDQVKEFSQEVFELAQSIYDKASVLEEKAKALGLDEYADVSKWEKMKTTASAAWDAVTHGKSMNSNEAYAVMNTMQSIEGVKSASLALMKSAAFNGATDVKGGKAAEAMKAEVVSKLSWKDFASTSLWGGLGILATGIGIVTGNPLLIAAGIYVNLKKGGEFAGKVTMSNVTKGEQMFGMKDSKIMNPAIQVYNQSQEAANIGDPKSASTYVTATQGALEIISGLMLMIGTAGVGTGVGISNIKDGIDSLYKLNKGGLDGNTRTLISNIYVLGERVEAWSGMDIPELEKLIQTLAETGADEADTRATAEYGTSSTDSVSADSKYSGYREQAKDSNIATDYNEGMEKETNEAVSDKYVKIFKTILNNEPEHIRKVLMEIKR